MVENKETSSVPKEHPLFKVLETWSQQDADLFLAMFFLNPSELERISDSSVKRIKWTEEKNRLQKMFFGTIPKYARMVAPGTLKLNDVYTELVKRIEKEEGFEIENIENMSDKLDTIILASLYQQPQSLRDELAEKVWCKYPPGQGDIYESYDSKEGMRVRARKLPGEVMIQLNPEKFEQSQVNFQKYSYNLVFDFKSDQVDEITIRLYNARMRNILQEQRSNLQQRRWISVEMKVPAEFFCLSIEPMELGVFYLRSVYFKLDMPISDKPKPNK